MCSIQSMLYVFYMLSLQGYFFKTLSCRVTLQLAKTRPRLSGTMTVFSSGCVSTSTTLCYMGRRVSCAFVYICQICCDHCKCKYVLCLHCRLQDISAGYWVLVLHFTRREAVRQIDELQHIATNLGRSET